ncbi:M56 family metallopeptidase [Sulfobacillus thermosulfidooxidans]|uniref:M56 family metallopeptidase n=1 Tax=Sulfobacillus thermosulfidooxidans TaxID=28034 RepID=UPI0002EF84B5|nr:M56 family metallopeptidase [Sulfobacillus thermosulfidooxidans]
MQEPKKNLISKVSQSAYTWATALLGLALLPGLLLILAAVITYRHMAWSMMQKPDTSPSGLTVLFVVFILLSLAYFLRLGYATYAIVKNSRQTIERIAPQLAPFPLSDLPAFFANQKIAVRMGLWESPDAFTYGVVHPTIVISRRLHQILDAPALTAILAHEVHHVRSHDYALQQIFLVILRAFPWLPLESVYRFYLTAREIRADQFAIVWQHTADHLMQAMVTTIHALREQPHSQFSGETAWNSVWQARINALINSETVPLSPEARTLFSAALIPFATSAVLAITSLSLFCH